MTEHERRTIPRPHERVDWLEARKPYVGASEAAALFGEHPFRTLGDVAVEKLHGIEQPENAAMRRGQLLEDAIAQWWAVEHGLDVSEVEQLYVVDDVLCVTLDRHVDGTNEALEVKSTSKLINEPERYWYWQCQAQAVAADLDRVQLAVLDCTLSLKSYTIERNEHDGDELIKRAKQFVGCVRAGVLPPNVFPSSEVMGQLYPESAAIAVDLDDMARGVIGELRSTRARIDTLKRRASELEGMLKSKLATAAEGFLEGQLVVTWRSHKHHDIDGKRLRADMPHVADEYTRTNTRRPLVLK